MFAALIRPFGSLFNYMKEVPKRHRRLRARDNYYELGGEVKVDVWKRGSGDHLGTGYAPSTPEEFAKAIRDGFHLGTPVFDTNLVVTVARYLMRTLICGAETHGGTVTAGITHQDVAGTNHPAGYTKGVVEPYGASPDPGTNPNRPERLWVCQMRFGSDGRTTQVEHEDLWSPLGNVLQMPTGKPYIGYNFTGDYGWDGSWSSGFAISYPDMNKVMFTGVVGDDDANGYTLREEGLFAAGPPAIEYGETEPDDYKRILFARKGGFELGKQAGFAFTFQHTIIF